MKIWAKTKEFSEGKYLVVRRDGTIPKWPHFVLGAMDPSTPATLRAYAAFSREFGLDEEYCASIEELADDFARYRDQHGTGDPDSGPHRRDDPAIIRLMRHGGRVRELEDAAKRGPVMPETPSEVTLLVFGDAMSDYAEGNGFDRVIDVYRTLRDELRRERAGE